MLSGPFSPIFDDDDDGFFGNHYRRSPFGMYNDRMSSRRALEERHRRAEMERYMQWKAQQQQLERQRQEEVLRRKQAEEAYIRRLRQAEQEEKLRRQRLEQQQRQPAYSIVIGPDGLLYRVPVDPDDDHEVEHRSPCQIPRPPKLARKSVQQPRIVRGPDGRLYRVQPDNDDSSMEIEHSDNESSKSDIMRDSPVPSPRSKSNHEKTTVNVTVGPSSTTKGQTSGGTVNVSLPAGNDQKNNRRRVTVIVEDVPESEYEDEELRSMKSTFRNRRPAIENGESWMQPIEV